MKKFTSLFIVLALVMTMSVGVFAADTYADEAAANAANVAAGTKITVAGVEYTAIDDANQITDLAGSYYLTKDITWPEKNLGDFTGSFNGGFHTITLSGDSMFSEVGNVTSVVSNFTIVGEEIIFIENNFGPVAYQVHGGEFRNINNYVDVLANAESVGGLFGTISSTSRSDTLVIENCTNHALVNGTQRSGGFIGSIGSISAMTNIIVRNCVNHGDVMSDGNYYSGGVLGSIQGAQTDFTINIENCVNNGTIAAAQSFVGGMIGGVYKANKTPTINISGCTNNGEVTCSASSSLHYGAGGIFGGADQSPMTLNVTGSVNNGAISALQVAGGIVGGISKVGNARALHVTVNGCINTGAVTIGDTGFCSAIVTCQNAQGNQSANIPAESSLVITNSYSTVADLALTSIYDKLDDGTPTIAPEISTTEVVSDVNAAVTALTGKIENTTFTANEGAVRVTVGTHTYENGFCNDCNAPDPYNPIVIENGDEGGEENPPVTNPPTTNTKAPETTTTPTTDPVDEEEKGGCKGFAAGSVAMISLMAVAGVALFSRKKEN